MREYDYYQIKKYRELFPEESDVLNRAIRVCDRHRMIDVFSELLDEAVETGLRVDWSPIFAVASDTKYRGITRGGEAGAGSWRSRDN